MNAMFSLTLFLSFALFHGSHHVHGSHNAHGSHHVLELGLHSIDKYLDGERFVFVFFYAPWHGECQKILARFKEVGDAFSGREDVVIAQVDAYREIKLATRFWIDDYPIFRFFIKGSHVEETYKGGRNPDDMIRFIEAKSFQRLNMGIFMTPVIDLGASNFERIVKDKERSIMILYFNGNCDLCNELQNTIYNVGLNFRNEPTCLLGRVNCDADVQLCIQQNIPHYPTFKVYSKHNKDGVIYEPGKHQESYSERNLTSFMNALCGTQRTTEGRLSDTAGRLHDMDDLARQFMQEFHRREEIVVAAKRASLVHESKPDAEFYLSVMVRVMHNGAGILLEEIDRLERLIAGPLHADKSDEFVKRKNILKQFQVLHYERDEL